MPALSVQSSDGTPLAYWREGSGPPLLLVHGGLCDHHAWYFVVPALARSFSVWTFDRRAHGLSGDRQPYAVEREVEDILVLLETIGEPAHLLGHSAGAILALLAAIRTDRLRSLILYEPPFVLEGARERPAPGILTEMQRLLAAGRPDDALRIAMRETVSLTDAEIDAMQAGPGWEHLRDAADAIPNDWRLWEQTFDPKSIGRMTAPALVIAGSESPAWIRASALAVLRALPAAHLAELHGQGHSAMITAPELFTGTVERFLSIASLSNGR
ncbi:MAG TPA: alpha/beta hydrolase [Acidobacteriaceae bacterium]|jgi:pimeloyl-ACP methyl ester carboxylesterase